MQRFLVGILIICSSLFSNELPKDMNSVDAYSEYYYKYYNNGMEIKFNTILKYQYNKSKNQFGFRDILLFSLKEISDEAKKLGYENFHILFFSEKDMKNVTIDDYLNNFAPSLVNYIYPYNVGKKDGVGLGSVVALGANVAMATVAVKNVNSGNNISSSSDVFAHSVDGVMTDTKGKNIFKDIGSSIDNKNEIDNLNKSIFYNTIEQEVWFMDDKNYDFKNPKTIKFSVQEVDKYFETNPYRIKELYTTQKHLITRGLKK